jgi:hypothetical protein
MITTIESVAWGSGAWLMRDDLTHRFARISKLGTSDVYEAVTWDGTRMMFSSLEEAKTWASIALRT